MEQQTKHTPGWKVDVSQTFQDFTTKGWHFYITDICGDIIATVHAKDKTEAQATAQLIAEAPTTAAERDSLKEEVEDFKTELSKCGQDLNDHIKENENLHYQVDKLKEENERLNTQVVKLLNKLKGTEAAYQRRCKEVTFERDCKNKVSDERDSLKIELENLKDDITEWDSRLSSSETERDKLKEEVERLTVYLEKEQYQDFSKLKEENERLAASNENLKKARKLSEDTGLEVNDKLRDINKSLVEALNRLLPHCEHMVMEYNTSVIYKEAQILSSQVKALNP